MQTHLRIARPVSDLARSRELWCAGVGLEVIASFTGHSGFDGVMLGGAGKDWHLEFTHCVDHPLLPAPTAEDLLVVYIPDAAAWQQACQRAEQAGFKAVASFNPYWDQSGATFVDHDGYRLVLQNRPWPAEAGG